MPSRVGGDRWARRWRSRATRPAPKLAGIKRPHGRQVDAEVAEGPPALAGGVDRVEVDRRVRAPDDAGARRRMGAPRRVAQCGAARRGLLDMTLDARSEPLRPRTWRGWTVAPDAVHGAGWLTHHAPSGELAGPFRSASRARAWVDRRVAGGPPQGPPPRQRQGRLL